MLKRFLGILLVIMALSASINTLAASDPRDRNGGKDHPLFTRMPNYWIYSYTENQFNKYEFPTSDKVKTTVEGHYYRINYTPNDKNPPSPLQIARNYINAAKSIGGQVLYTSKNEWEAVLKITKNETETWVHVIASDTSGYFLIIVERQAMNQDVVANADAMAQGINTTGKVALDGIYFDTGKAEIKPESQPSLQEIAKYLKREPKLNFYVVGHTDDVGTFESNLKLSKDRADAVVKALVGQYGIPASQLTAWGDGPTAPVASNTTEEGKAQNRRVELVVRLKI